jgi:hypothetical protein
MKRRKTSRRAPVEARYAPTYTETGSFLMVPISSDTFANNQLTVAQLLALANPTGSTNINVKLSSVTFSLRNGTQPQSVTRGVLEFASGETHVITDVLKAAKVKPSKANPDGFWINGADPGNTARILFRWNFTALAGGVVVDYVGISIRYSNASLLT